jgi:septum formation protein
LTLVLASASPQRRAILESLGVAFEVRPAAVAEIEDGQPRAVARENALRKALGAAPRAGETVLGVDTLVATGNDIWGKPPDEQTARETLRRLSGRTHEVISGFAVVRDGAVEEGEEVTEVTFRDLDEATIDWYVARGEWRERAGGYAIQGCGAALVRRLDGDYLNVVGLPVAALICGRFLPADLRLQ